jgi:hypothetical protein
MQDGPQPSGEQSCAELIAHGRALLAEQRSREAAAVFAAATRLRLDDPAGHYLLGEALFLQRRLDAALACHAVADRLAEGRGTGRADAMSGMIPGDFGWMSHMLRGDFERAWELADRDRARRQAARITGAGWPRHMRPVWDGRPLAGRRVLVRCYHGLGDTIQFIRYLPLLGRDAACVRVEAQPQLTGLLRPLVGAGNLHALPETEDVACAEFGCDLEIDVTELPHACRTELNTIPANTPYLRPDAARETAAADKLGSLAPRLAVGICWAAGAWRPERSLPFDLVKALAETPGIALVNLQRGPEYLRHRCRFAELPIAEMVETDDIADAAATIAGLDLVISVDTMVAHLAGALAVPTWLVLHYAADWRWLLDRDDSPWYPSMRLFRQERPGEWVPVMAAIASALRILAAARGGAVNGSADRGSLPACSLRYAR